jgi:hypothetical protein
MKKLFFLVATVATLSVSAQSSNDGDDHFRGPDFTHSKKHEEKRHHAEHYRFNANLHFGIHAKEGPWKDRIIARVAITHIDSHGITFDGGFGFYHPYTGHLYIGYDFFPQNEKLDVCLGVVVAIGPFGGFGFLGNLTRYHTRHFSLEHRSQFLIGTPRKDVFWNDLELMAIPTEKFELGIKAEIFTSLGKSDADINYPHYVSNKIELGPQFQVNLSDQFSIRALLSFDPQTVREEKAESLTGMATLGMNFIPYKKKVPTPMF